MLAALFIYLNRRRYAVLYPIYRIRHFKSFPHPSPFSMPEEMEGDGDGLTFRTLLASLNLLAPKNPGKEEETF
jgi:hypothetical protein